MQIRVRLRPSVWPVLFLIWPIYLPLLYWLGPSVWIDGVDAGRLRWLRTASFDVLPGRHTVEVRGGFLGGVATVGVRAAPGEVVRLEIGLASRLSPMALDGRAGTIFPPELHDLRVGDRVLHAEWGSGGIQELEAAFTSDGVRGVPARAFATIDFDDGHTRTIDLDVEELRDL